MFTLIKLIFIILCVAPNLPPSFRCQYQAYAEGRNLTTFAVTVIPLDDNVNVKDFINKNREPAFVEGDVPAYELSEDDDFEGDDLEGDCSNAKIDAVVNVPLEDTSSCKCKGDMSDLEASPVGNETEPKMPCDEDPPIPEETASKSVESPAEDNECPNSPEEDSMVMAECRSCNARLSPNGSGVKLTCYDCQHQHGDQTCHFNKFDAKFRVSTKFFEVAGFGQTNSTST